MAMPLIAKLENQIPDIIESEAASEGLWCGVIGVSSVIEKLLCGFLIIAGDGLYFE